MIVLLDNSPVSMPAHGLQAQRLSLVNRQIVRVLRQLEKHLVSGYF